MRRRDFILAAPAVVAPLPGAPIPELDQLLAKLMSDGHVPGLSIAVLDNAKLVWRRGFGVKDATTKQPVDDSTMFEAASMSKPVFAYAVMKLVEQGVLDLDRPLSTYIRTRFLEGDPRLDRITARHVLSHTAGFQDWRSGADPLRIHFTPGDKYLYSGEGYFYLQSVVTHLKGRENRSDCARFEADLEVCATGIDDYMRSNVLVPLGMTSSTYLCDAACAARMARPPDPNGRPLEPGKSSAPGAARYAAAGGLFCTPTDYAKFFTAILNLNRRMLTEMLRPHVKATASTSWALGWEIRHTPGGDLFQHEGGQRGFQCFGAASLAHKRAYVAMTNSESGYKVFYHERFVALMTRYLTKA